MLTKEQADVIRAKDEEDRTADEIAALTAFDAKTAKEKDLMVPKSRLDEALERARLLEEKANKAEAEANALKANAEKKERERLEAEKNYQALYETTKAEVETLKPQAATLAAQLAALEDSQKATLAAQINEIPEDRRSLVPTGLSTKGQLDWLTANRAILMAPRPFDIGAGARGGSGGGGGDSPKLSDVEKQFAAKLGMTEKEYAENRERES